MASRFEKVDDEFIEELKEMSENENTKKSTEYWKNVFKKWATERNVNANLEEYECDALDQTLSQFYAELRKENGEDYEPDSLKVMQAAMERYLKSKSYPKSIIRDREFINSRKVLEGKARKLREQGKGKRPNRSKSLTKEEEEVLWQNGQLGSGTPRALINTMWWLMTQHFGLRGRQEHHQMKVEDFTLQRDDDGTEFLTFDEGLTKTRQGGLSVKNRLVTPKMFATGHEERCPVMLFKLYLEKRPKEMKTSGPFYLSVIDKPVSSIWFKKTPVGKNTINTIMKKMKENSPLKELCPQKKITNHSARKTVVKKLKRSGVPKSEIKNITGHASAQGLDDYDSGDEREQQMISRIIDDNGPGPSRGILSQLYPANSSTSTLACAPGHVYNFSNCSVTLNIAGNDAVQKSSSSSRGHKRIFIEDSDSE